MTTTNENELVEDLILDYLRDNDDVATTRLEIKVNQLASKAGLTTSQRGTWITFRNVLGRLERQGTIINTGTRTFGHGSTKNKHWAIPAVHEAALADKAERSETEARIRARIVIVPFADGLAVELDPLSLDGTTILAIFRTSDLFDAREEADKFARQTRNALIAKTLS